MAKIICVANRKGGVGKTTLATNLAVALNNKGKSILLDADEQQSAADPAGSGTRAAVAQYQRRHVEPKR